MRTLSNFVSYLFHPIFIPLYAILLMMVSNPYRYDPVMSPKGGYLVIYVMMYTVILPMILMTLMKRLKLIDSMKLHERGERLLPLMIMTFFSFFAFLALKRADFHPDISKVFLAASIVLMIAYILTVVSGKISLHTIGMGALVAIAMHSSLFSVYITYPILFAVIIVAGLVGTARLQLKAHDSKEVFQGYFLGYFIQMLVFIY